MLPNGAWSVRDQNIQITCWNCGKTHQASERWVNTASGVHKEGIFIQCPDYPIPISVHHDEIVKALND